MFIERFVTRCFQFYHEMVRRLSRKLYVEGVSIDLDKFLIDPLGLFMKAFDYKEESRKFPWNINFILRADENRYTKLYVALEDGDKVYVTYENNKEICKKGEFHRWCHYICTGFVDRKRVD